MYIYQPVEVEIPYIFEALYYNLILVRCQYHNDWRVVCVQ